MIHKVMNEKNEIWYPIKNHEGYYEISNYGRVKSLKRKVNNQYGDERILKLFPDSSGYLQARLHSPYKKHTIKVHKLVWNHFGNNDIRADFARIDHIDENKSNNYIGNLQLLTHRENVSKSSLLKKRSKLPTGVFKSNKKIKKYRAAIRIKNKYIALGNYKTKDEAELAYINAKRKLNENI